MLNHNLLVLQFQMLTLYYLNVKITGNLSFTLTQDGYANVSFSGLAIGTIYDNKNIRYSI